MKLLFRLDGCSNKDSMFWIGERYFRLGSLFA